MFCSFSLQPIFFSKQPFYGNYSTLDFHTNIVIHQSIPPPLSQPPPPRTDPRALAFFALDGKFPGWGLLSCQIPRGGDEKRGQMPRPPSTLQHFSLIAQSNSAILSNLMRDFLFQLTSSFVIALGF